MIGYAALAAVTILVFAFVIQPLLAARRQALPITPARLADLRARRQYLLEAIADVDFDFASGKIGPEEYDETRGRFIREAAQVMRDLERETEDVDDDIDSEISRLRALARSRQPAGEASDPS